MIDDETLLDSNLLSILTLTFGVWINLLIKIVLIDQTFEKIWYRTLVFLFPLACMIGKFLKHENDEKLLEQQKIFRGKNEHYVLLLHVLCVILLILTSNSNIANNSPPPLPLPLSSSSWSWSLMDLPEKIIKKACTCQEIVDWMLAHPPSFQTEAAFDLWQLFRSLSLTLRHENFLPL
jgi:hypothetical protein